MKAMRDGKMNYASGPTPFRIRKNKIIQDIFKAQRWEGDAKIVEKQRAIFRETHQTNSSPPPTQDKADRQILEAAYKEATKREMWGTYVRGLGEHDRRDPKTKRFYGSRSTAASQTSLASQVEVSTFQKKIEESENQYTHILQPDRRAAPSTSTRPRRKTQTGACCTTTPLRVSHCVCRGANIGGTGAT